MSMPNRSSRIANVHRWLSYGVRTEPPPSHWTVRSPDLLTADWEGKILSAGKHKRAHAARLRGKHGRIPDLRRQGSVIPVVVKSPSGGAVPTAVAARVRTESVDVAPHVHAEILYLEHLRGQPGVPWLFGAWFRNGTLNYVVQHAGTPLGNGLETVHLSTSYREAASKNPLVLAAALLRCFQSFGEGGYFMEDFLPKQFFLDGKGDRAVVYLVDGPRALSGPVYDLLKAEPEKFAGQLWPHAPQGSCLSASDCQPTKWSHCCCRAQGRASACPKGSIGAPEARGQCNLNASEGRGAAGRCAAISLETVIFDVAAKGYMLPLLAQAAPMLQNLIDEMRLPRPQSRPTFAQVWQKLRGLSSRRDGQAALRATQW